MRRIKHISAVLVSVMVFFLFSPSAEAAKYKYDSLSRLTEVTYNNGTKVCYSYDPAGNILSATTVLPYIKVNSIDPWDKVFDVPVNKIIKITFNEAIIQGDLYDRIELQDGDGIIISSVTCINDNTLILTPEKSLRYNTTYRVIIPAGAIKNSTGKTLASEYVLSFKTRFVEYGDVNGDGAIDSEDSNRLKDYVLNGATNPMSDYEMMAADVDGDGKITSTDYAIIKRRLKTP